MNQTLPSPTRLDVTNHPCKMRARPTALTVLQLMLLWQLELFDVIVVVVGILELETVDVVCALGIAVVVVGTVIIIILIIIVFLECLSV